MGQEFLLEVNNSLGLKHLTCVDALYYNIFIVLLRCIKLMLYDFKITITVRKTASCLSVHFLFK